jgi:hypothetical protein
MADCSDLFQTFHDRIRLPSSKREYLMQARDAIRDRVRKHFKEEIKCKVPKFWIQGSYAMKTVANPLDGEYDIDDGIYLQNLDGDKEKWPSTSTVHNWVYKAVKGNTDKDPVDKRTCVRVIYSGKYHVDLPIYGENKGLFYLAEKGEKGWNESNPRGLTEWFKNEVGAKGEQLRRFVRYLKAWADFKGKNNGEMPSGLLLTVLGAYSYEKHDRDDTCVGGTVRNIYANVSTNFVVYNPVDYKEDLANHLTESQKETFKDLLSKLLASAGKALKEETRKKASETWQKEFGDRFPIGDDPDKKKELLVTSAPALLKNDARSA